jgi:hypothetical protein
VGSGTANCGRPTLRHPTYPRRLPSCRYLLFLPRDRKLIILGANSLAEKSSGIPHGESMRTCMMCTSLYVKANGDIPAGMTSVSRISCDTSHRMHPIGRLSRFFIPPSLFISVNRSGRGQFLFLDCVKDAPYSGTESCPPHRNQKPSKFCTWKHPTCVTCRVLNAYLQDCATV